MTGRRSAWARRAAAALTGLAALLGAGTATAAAPQPLRVLIDDSYPPYTFRDDQGELQGILPEIWALWSERTGIPVQVLGLDWAEAQRRFARGEAEVLDTAFHTPARDAIWDFSPPYADIEVVALFGSDLGGITDARSLRGFSVGVKDGDACIDFLEARGITSFERLESYQALVDAIERGQVRVACIDRPPATYLLGRKGLAGRFNVTAPLYHGEFHWVVRKNDTETYRLVADGFARVSEADRAAITARWLGHPLFSDKSRFSTREIATVVLGVAAAGSLLLAWVVTLRRRVGAQTRTLTLALSDLARSEARFRIIFDSISEAILILDPIDGQVMLGNRRAQAMFGQSPGGVAGRRYADLIVADPPFAAEDWQAMFTLSAEAPQQFEWPARRADGSTVWLAIELRRAAFGESGPRVVMTARDVSGRKEAEENLTRTIDALTRSNTDLERFAYAASHDLREPLNTVVRYAQFLDVRYRGRLDSDADDFIGFIVGAAKQMMRLVEGLLEFSRVDSVGRGFDTVEADRALDVALGYLGNAIAEAGATIVRRPLPIVAADEVQLVQLFQNLIGNALKYRDRDRPARIEIECGRAGEQWDFCVADNGIGIEPGYLEQIFVIFKRLHTQSAIPGVGIGLALCKRIVERHGGTIWVESTPGTGTRFHFTLNPPPAAPPTEPR